MNITIFKNDFLLLLTAVIWGFAFTAQRAGMEFTGPFTFNGIRFLLGAASLLPLIYFNRRKQSRTGIREGGLPKRGKTVLYGAAVGFFLFLGASFQQMGVVYTTAGKAGFITGMYVIIVPILGIFFGHKAGLSRWAGALLSLAGLYLLSIQGVIKVNPGDLLVLLSAFFWASHVLAVSWFSPKTDSLLLAFYQYLFCGLLSMAAAMFTESISLQMILKAGVPIFYGGVFSVGIAYTLQVHAQKNVHPAHAAIILSLEGVFAVAGGWIILSESMSAKGIIGCLLMLGGMFISQSREIAQSGEKAEKRLSP